MKKIKNFVKNHKEVILGSMLVVGNVIVGKVIHDIGVEKGTRYASTAWLAMLNADTDETLMLRDHFLLKTKLENDRDFIKYGHKLIKDLNDLNEGLVQADSSVFMYERSDGITEANQEKEE